LAHLNASLKIPAAQFINMITIKSLPFRLHPSNFKMLGALLISFVFIAGGLLTVRTEPLIGYACIVFFGLCAVLCLVSFLPACNYLDVGQSGITFSSFFRRTFVQWNQIQQFVVFQGDQGAMVGLKHTAAAGALADIANGLEHDDPFAGNPDIDGWVDIALPSVYGMQADALAALLNTVLSQRLPATISP
jgi:hypothetical protein